MIVGRGCGNIRGSKLIICDLEYKVRWYHIKIKALGLIFEKHNKKSNLYLDSF